MTFPCAKRPSSAGYSVSACACGERDASSENVPLRENDDQDFIPAQDRTKSRLDDLVKDTGQGFARRLSGLRQRHSHTVHQSTMHS